MASSKPRIVIIGAGMAGLTAARKLYMSAGNRFEVLVVEGGGKIGGRISSSEFGGATVEQGATWIHGIDGSPVYKMALETGSLSSDDQPWEGMDGIPIPGEPVTMAEGGHKLAPYLVDPVSRLFNDLLDFVQGDGNGDYMKNLSVGEFLRQGLEKHKGSVEWKGINGVGNWDLESLQEAVFAMHECKQRAHTSADDLGDLDYVSEREYVMLPGEEITIPNGYSSVIQSMASTLPVGMIQLGQKVKRIEWQDNGLPAIENGRGNRPVKLHFGDGSTISADHVIVTVSLGVLKREICLESGFFTPPLSDSKTGAISRLGYGTVNKVFLRTAQTEETNPNFPFLQMVFHPPDSKSRHPNIPPWIRKTASLSPIYKNSRVLVSWFAGQQALEIESLSDDEIISGFSVTVSNMLPSHNPWNKTIGNNNPGGGGTIPPMFDRILRTQWGTNPLFQGSYSYVAVGSSTDDIDTLAEPLPEAENWGNLEGSSQSAPLLQILFAGEATHKTHYSTTHGAYFSGLREANRLLKHYRCING